MTAPAARLNADPSPMEFASALRAVRNALGTRPDACIVNEDANTLDFAHNIESQSAPDSARRSDADPPG